jgi:hypothetical protein
VRPTPTIVLLLITGSLALKKGLVTKLNLKTMEWYVKNRWWIWTITGVYLAYRIITGLMYS